jgi:hypothetical protein
MNKRNTAQTKYVTVMLNLDLTSKQLNEKDIPRMDERG